MLYKVMIPSNYTVLTGTIEEMLPIVNSLFDQSFTEMSNDSFFATLHDGMYNDKVVTVINGVYKLV